MIDLQKLISEEVEKQLVNRGIASKSWSLQAIASTMVKHEDLQHCNFNSSDIKVLQKQVKKIFAMMDKITERFPSVAENKEEPKSFMKADLLRDLEMFASYVDCGEMADAFYNIQQFIETVGA